MPSDCAHKIVVDGHLVIVCPSSKSLLGGERQQDLLCKLHLPMTSSFTKFLGSRACEPKYTFSTFWAPVMYTLVTPRQANVDQSLFMTCAQQYGTVIMICK